MSYSMFTAHCEGSCVPLLEPSVDPVHWPLAPVSEAMSSTSISVSENESLTWPAKSVPHAEAMSEAIVAQLPDVGADPAYER
jgi:hypothetical protein